MYIPTWAIAILKVATSFAAAVGVNLQKLSMGREEARCQLSGLAERAPFFQPLWIFGMTFIVLDSVGDFFFIGLAPQSLLTPLGALSLGFNAILAPIFHSEVVTTNVVAATAIIYCGTITTVVYGPKERSDFDLDDMRAFASAPEFGWYSLFCALFLCSFCLHGMKRGYGMLHYCALAGCLGGQTILLAKCSSELLLDSLLNEDFGIYTSSPIPYVLICSMIGFLLTQLHHLYTGLHKFEALRVVPVYQSFFIVFGITGGLIFFHEYRTMSWMDLIMYYVGIAILLVGVVLLVRQRAKSGSDDEPLLEEAEDGGYASIEGGTAKDVRISCDVQELK